MLFIFAPPSGSSKTLAKLKNKVQTKLAEQNLGISVTKIIKGNAAKPALLRELFIVRFV